MSEKENLINTLELIIRRGAATATNDVTYFLHHNLGGEIAGMLRDKNITEVEAAKQLADAHPEVELSNAIKGLMQKTIKTYTILLEQKNPEKTPRKRKRAH